MARYCTGDARADVVFADRSRGERPLLREVRPHQSYLATLDHRLHFGLGNIDAVDRVVVTWPDGTERRFDDVATNRYLTFRR